MNNISIKTWERERGRERENLTMNRYFYFFYSFFHLPLFMFFFIFHKITSSMFNSVHYKTTNISYFGFVFWKNIYWMWIKINAKVFFRMKYKLSNLLKMLKSFVLLLYFLFRNKCLTVQVKQKIQIKMNNRWNIFLTSKWIFFFLWLLFWYIAFSEWEITILNEKIEDDINVMKWFR